MTKIHTYLALVMMVFLSLIPPINFFISNPSNDKWFIIVLLAAFLGFYTIFVKVNPIVRVIAIWIFIDCFFSAAPYVSFTSYISTVLCCYFYILCTKIEDWQIIFKAFQTLLFLNVFMILMQATGHDSLLNFGLGHDFTCYGVIGQHMQMGSFSVVLCAFLILFNPLNFIFPFLVAIFCNSSWSVMAAACGLFVILRSFNKRLSWIILSLCVVLFLVFAGLTHKISANTVSETGRFNVWTKSIELANQRPIFGWGPGTYKELFHALSKIQSTPYKTAHNWLIQLLFETGYPFTILMVGSLGLFVWRLYKARKVALLAGLAMISCDMMVHFPERMIQCVMIIICFLAYCDKKTTAV